MSLKITTPPMAEPVTRDEVKKRLHLTSTADDTTIDGHITAAREFCESVSGRSLVAKSYAYTTERFPYPNRAMQLLRPPLVQVTAVKYLDEDGAWQTWDPLEYLVGVDQAPGVIKPKKGFVYPCPAHQEGLDTVKVEYDAGADTLDPESVRRSITDVAVFIYGHPGEPIPVNLVQIRKIHYF